MRTLHIDLETYSDVDLPSCGVYKYVESSAFEILLFAYSYDEGMVSVIDLTQPDISIPYSVLLDIVSNDECIKIAHNASFERICLSRYLDLHLTSDSWHCTMVHASMLGMPSALAKVTKCLGLPIDQQKDSSGKSLIKYFCCPCAPTKINGGRTRNRPSDAPDKWLKFIDYNRQDVVAEIAVYDKLAKFPILKQEHVLWCLDQRINDYGMLIDSSLVQTIMDFASINDASMVDECIEITNGVKPSEIAKIKSWVAEREDRAIESLDKEAVTTLLKDKTLSTDTRRVLEIRQQTGKTSVSKYDAIARAMCSDNRLHGCFQYYGANRTGRWAGRIFQPQNLPRNTFDDFDGARQMIQEGDIDLVDLMYDSYNNVFSTLIRTMVIPPIDHVFAVADYSAIEARVTAWFCDERWRQEVFADDGKIYEASAAQMFGVPIESVTKGSELRKKGKVAELALGYGGGVSALERMGGGQMGLTEIEMNDIKNRWRATSPRIAKMWYKIGSAVESAVMERRRVDVAHGMYYWYSSGILFAHLPSGRDLAYVRPKIVKGKFGKELEYEGSSTDKDDNGKLKYSGGWGRQHAWGGKLFENLIQAIARDCLAEAMINIDKAGYKIIMHVHDEVIVEVPRDSAKKDLHTLESIMSEPIAWAPELLLTADGFITDYYRKD